MLTARGRRGDRDYAEALLGAAVATYDELGMKSYGSALARTAR
jgi:hypothetical protein